MGLDISYYRNVRRIRDLAEDGEYDYPRETYTYANPEFSAQADGLADGIYEGEAQDGFRAGSYGGYNVWRDNLARLTGIDGAAAVWAQDYPSGPFVELINFSDCEGMIGPSTSAKLAKDFADYQDRADNWADDYWRELYGAWRTAFETAAQAGFVLFH